MNLVRTIYIFLLLVVSPRIISRDFSEILSTEILTNVEKFTAGESYPIAIALYINEQYHINGNETADEFLIPTVVKFNSRNNFTFGKINYPASKSKLFEYSEQKILEAKEQQKPVMIDFFADWCVPCKEMDAFTFSQQEVIDMSKNFLMLKVDLTTEDNPQAKALKSKFHIKGVPTIVFLDSNGEELSNLRIVGFLEHEELLPIIKVY